MKKKKKNKAREEKQIFRCAKKNCFEKKNILFINFILKNEF